ncbi:MAG: hypothetical protein KF900_07400 [Bacteroidetes bacterium]|nr:hypothetical protein [Bacteroidota bacterium]
MRGSFAFLVILFAVSALVVFLSPQAIEREFYPNLFYNYFVQNITGKFSILALNFLFLFLGTVWIALITQNQEVVDKQNYFPVFLYLLFGVACVSPMHVTSQIFTNVFVLYSVYKLLDTYREDQALKDVFEAAFWLSVSAFVTISSVIYVPLFFIILLILRAFHWREWAVAVIGFLLPVFIYECVAYLTNFNRWYIFDAVELYFQSLRLPSFSEYYLPLSLTLFVMLLISIFYNLANGFGNTVKKQRAKTILLWFLFFSTLGFFSGGANSSSIILTYSFPLSFFIGDYLFSLKSLKISNTILALLLFCVAIVFMAQFGLV